MALNPTELGLALATASNPTGPGAVEITQWTAIANAIISHFIANAVITLSPEGLATIISAPTGGPVTGVSINPPPGAIS